MHPINANMNILNCWHKRNLVPHELQNNQIRESKQNLKERTDKEMANQGETRRNKVEYILIGVLAAVTVIVAFKFVNATTIKFDTLVGSLEVKLTLNREKLSQPELITVEHGKQGENPQISMESKD